VSVTKGVTSRGVRSFGRRPEKGASFMSATDEARQRVDSHEQKALQDRRAQRAESKRKQKRTVKGPAVMSEHERRE